MNTGFGPQRFAWHASTLASLTRRSSGSASPPTELQTLGLFFTQAKVHAKTASSARSACAFSYLFDSSFCAFSYFLGSSDSFSAIFLAVLAVLSVVLFLALALARFWQQRFAKRAGFNIAVLTRRCIGSASPPAEL